MALTFGRVQSLGQEIGLNSPLLLFFLARLANWAALQTMNQPFPSRPPLFLGFMLKLNPPWSE
jgi:hypothetical protein